MSPKISTILDLIDNGKITLPEFQRGYVWNRDQVRKLFYSLYHRHPVGSLLIWVTDAQQVRQRGGGNAASGTIDLLLDGQQRITSLYGVLRGRPPAFFDGNEKAFTDMYFNVQDESFSFYQPTKMKDSPLWIDVTELMLNGIGGYLAKFPQDKRDAYINRLIQLRSIQDIQFHSEQITNTELPVVVDIFNRVNSSGTKLSTGDLALAKICANWPQARDVMKSELQRWEHDGFDFDLDWLLRSVNTVLTGEARFTFLHDKDSDEMQDGLNRAIKAIDMALNMIGGRTGLDHGRVLFGRYAIPVIARYLDQRKGQLGNKERDKLLFWYLQVGMWGYFSGSTESLIDRNLDVLEQSKDQGLDALLRELKLWGGYLRVEPDHFDGWSVGNRSYPILYMLTRMRQAQDWGSGLELKTSHLGRMNKLEMHHIFPKAQLYKRDYGRQEVNALANFCFLTKDTNLDISDSLPEEYFPEIEEQHPGALESQWIPMSEELWRVGNYRDFLEARRDILAAATNQVFEELLHGETHWLEASAAEPAETEPSEAPSAVMGSISSEEEEQELHGLNAWMEANGLPHGLLEFGFADPETGEQKAVFDLVWPEGIQQKLSEPVAVLLNEGSEVIALATNAGYRCFIHTGDFKRYVEAEFLSEGADAEVPAS